MDSTLKNFLASGKKLLGDTTTARAVDTKKQPKSLSINDTETDPHRRFVKRVIREKPTKKELVKDLEQFIAAAEAQL